MKKQSSATESLLDPVVLKKASLVYRATNNKVRQQILRLIAKHERIVVTTIYKKLRMEQSVASQHLGVLRREGIVNAQKEGKFVYYSINHHKLEEMHKVAEILQTMSIAKAPAKKNPVNKKPSIWKDFLLS